MKTTEKFRKSLRESGYKTFRGRAKDGRDVYEDSYGSRVLVDWTKQTYEVVFSEDGSWHHLF